MMRRSSCWLRGGAARRSHGRVICWRRRWQVLNEERWHKKYQLSIGVSLIQRVHKLFASRNVLTVGWLVGLRVGDFEGTYEKRAN